MNQDLAQRDRGLRESVTVVWWWDPRLDQDLPRRYGIRWTTASGSVHGSVLVSGHGTDPADPNDPSIEAALRAETPRAVQYQRSVRLVHARAATAADLTAEAQLAIAGFPLEELPLDTSDPGFIGGISALETSDSAQGIEARVILRAGLTATHRQTFADWAVQSLRVYLMHRGEQCDLEELGWTATAGGRMQALAYQRR